MPRFSILLRLTALLALCTTFSCSRESPTPQSSPTTSDTPLTIATTFYPTTYFTQRIAGDFAVVVCPVPEDADPIFWQPAAEDIGVFQQADLIVLNGAGFERWAKTVALPPSRVVDTAAGFASTHITSDGPTHSHGTDGDHTHDGLDGHTWLDPINAIEQCRAIHDALAKLLPEHADTLRSNLDSLTDDLRQLDSRFIALADQTRGTQFVASHPAYNYLARRYQWHMANLDLDPAQPITNEQLGQLRAAGLPTSGLPSFILWESAPIASTINKIESELGTPMILFSPVETLSAERIAAGENYLTVMNASIDRLEAAYFRGEFSNPVSP